MYLQEEFRRKKAKEVCRIWPADLCWMWVDGWQAEGRNPKVLISNITTVTGFVAIVIMVVVIITTTNYYCYYFLSAYLVVDISHTISFNTQSKHDNCPPFCLNVTNESQWEVFLIIHNIEKKISFVYILADQIPHVFPIF